MKSIERRFKRNVLNNPNWSSWTCFADAIIGQNFSGDRIKRHFNVLVDKDDYEKKDKMQLLKYLYQINGDKP